MVGFRSRMEEKERMIKTRLFLFALVRRGHRCCWEVVRIECYPRGEMVDLRHWARKMSEMNGQGNAIYRKLGQS